MVNEFDRRISLRLPEKLALEIEGYIAESGMSFTEFLRRACREKLERDKKLSSGMRELPGSYLSQEDFNIYLKAALKNPDIKKIILSIIKN